MKKTIAMLSALAISASLVMPFSAFAEETTPVTVTKLTQDDFQEYAMPENRMISALGLEKYAAAPASISVTTGTVNVIYGYNDDGGISFAVAVYENGNLKTGSENAFEFYQLEENIRTGTVYYFVGSTISRTISENDIDHHYSPRTQVKYEIEAAYTVTIPAKVTLSSDEAGQTATFKIEGKDSGSAPKLAEDKTVQVTLTGAEHGFDGTGEATKLKVVVPDTENEAYATYQVKNAEGTVIGKDGTIAAFAYDPTATSEDAIAEAYTKQATFTAPQGAIYAGTYKDTLTFTIALVDTQAGA